MADKWAVLIVGLLLSGPQRFGELRRAIEGVSQKMLTQTLRSLERDGIVHREVFASVPPKVEYSLTPLGVSLAGKLDGLRIWAEENMQAVFDHQKSFDEALGLSSPAPP